MGERRWRVVAVAVLLAVYLAAALLLSSVAVREPRPQRARPPSRARRPAAARPTPSRPEWCRPLSYLSPPRPPVGLVSFPGSGNTWLRYLLQQATGLHTGSVYRDYGLLKNGFPAEAVANGSVLVVKTHEWGPGPRAAFSGAVLLLRSPDAAILAEFNRQSGGHVGFASPDRYRRTQGRHWRRFVEDKRRAWSGTYLDWTLNFSGPLHLVFYDRLVEDTERTLVRLLAFLDVRPDEDTLRCALRRREGIYRRKRRPAGFDPFTPDMRLSLSEERERVYAAVERRRREDLLSGRGRLART